MVIKQRLLKISILAFTFALMGTVTAQTPLQCKQAEKKGINPDKWNSNLNWSQSAKEVLFYEDFSTFDNWTVVGENDSNWIISNAKQCGGIAFDASMVFTPTFPGTSRLVSPVINTNGSTDIGLSFLHALYLWSGEGRGSVSVETTSDGGNTWTQVWELCRKTENDYNAFEVLTINSTDVGSENFQFCFKFEDYSNLINWWSIDNVTLGSAVSYDATVISKSLLEGTLNDGIPVNVSGTVMNLGSETASFDVKLEIIMGSSVVFESTKTVTDLAFGESAVVAFDTWTTEEGSYSTRVATHLTGDDNPLNDEVSSVFVVASNDYYCIPSANCSYGDGINNFIFAGIKNTVSGCSPGGYGNFTDMTAYVEIGNNYTARVSSNYHIQMLSVWIDFNQDWEFSDDERVLTDYSMADGGVFYDLEITIPPNVSPVSTYMRVGASWITPSSPNSCGVLAYGEWEDYSIEITGSQISYNVGTMSIDMGTYIVDGDIIPKATVKNWGLETVSFPVTCNINEGYSSTVNVTDLAYNEAVQLSFDLWDASPGTHTVVVETNLAGDEIPGNNLTAQQVTIVPYAPVKRVVGEEGTGTWCGWCVRGIVFMEYMALTYPETWIGIGVHNNDPMVVPAYNAGIGFYAFPSGLVDRTITVDPADFESAYETKILEVSPAGISITAKSFNETSGELSFTLTSDFVADVTNFRFLGVLIENFVTGTGGNWAQANYYSGGTNGPMGGFENLPNPVPAANMIYMDVARALLGPIDGVAGSLPANILGGETHSYAFTTTVANNWNMENVEIVGMLINVSTGEIVNAVKDHAIGTVGVVDITLDEYDILVYPNPATDRINIKSGSDIKNILVYNHIGQLVYKGRGISKIMEFNISSLKAGLYLFSIETVGRTHFKSVLVK